jgi:SAM-dependent methyltransferase
MTDAAHWEAVYGAKRADEVSWYRPHLDRSLALIDALALSKNAHVLDAGAGASTLVDDLLARGFTALTLVDLSKAALEVTRARLGPRGASVRFLVGDASAPLVPDASVDLWHDRAVFHFQTDPAKRSTYVERIARAVRPGGHVILATFALDGPERCSNLPVARHDAAGLLAELGPRFAHVRDEREAHTTPKGGAQSFTYLVARRLAE